MKETEEAEFSFDARQWHRLLLLVAGVCCAGGLLAGVIGGHPWHYTFKCAVGLPLLFAPLLWLIGLRGYHRSYLVTSQGVTIRRHGRDIEHLPWAEISDIRPRPLTIIIRSGRRIEPWLMRPELDRARDFLLDTFKTHDRNA